MDPAPARRFTFADLRRARDDGRKIPVLTCYDYTTATLLHAAGVPAILVGDSAANVILGHPTTLPVSLGFMTEIAAAVRRGAPDALLIGDLPFGSYHASVAQGVRAACRLIRRSGCDAVKIEAGLDHGEMQLRLVGRLADAGVAVVGHLGLKPQSVGLLGGYRAQGRTSDDARRIVRDAVRLQDAGAAGLVLEAVPPEVAEAVVAETDVPVIGCGAGPACHGHVVVTHDLLGLTPNPPRFAPRLGDVGDRTVAAVGEYLRQVADGRYPAAGHAYEMPLEERETFAEHREGEARRRRPWRETDGEDDDPFPPFDDDPAATFDARAGEKGGRSR